MILKRLLSLSFCTRQKYSSIGSRYYFSSNQQKQPQNQPQSQTIAPQQNNNEQAPKEVPEKNVANMQKPWKKRERYDDEQKWYQVVIVDKYLHYKKPQLDVQKLLPELQKLGSEKQIKQRIEEQKRNVEKRKLIPLQKYEKELNLYPEILGELSGSKSLIDPNKKKYNRINLEEEKKNLFRNQSRAQFNNYCQSSQKIRVSEKDFKQIYQILEQQPSKSYLINLFYYEVQSKNFNPISQRFIHVIRNNIFSGLYPEANPLKFLWFAVKQHNQLTKEYATIFVRQLNKIHINNKSIHKQLKQLTYFYLDDNTSSKIVQSLLGVSKSAEQLIKNWYLTMMIVSRIKKQSTNSSQIHEIINHIGEQRVKNFLKKNLLILLLQDNHLIMFQRYKSALQKKQHSKQINSQESPFGLEHLIKNSKVEYLFQNDIPIVCELGKKTVSHIPFKSVQYSTVENLIKGNYHQYLQYYKDNFVDDEQQLFKIVQYQKEAQKQFESQDQQALYVFKKLLKKPTLNFQNLDLTKGLFGSIFKNLRNYQSSASSQTGNKFFKNKTLPRQNSNLQEKVEDQSKSEESEIKPVKETNEVIKKERKEKKGWNKKQSANFSTTKNSGLEEQEKASKIQSEKHYEQYLRTVKQTGEEINKKQKQNNKILEEELLFKPSEIFDFKQSRSVEDIQNQFKKHIHEINANNIGNIMRSYSLIPVVSNINVLLKFYFYNFKTQNPLPTHIQSDLKIQFKSTIGEIDKNYSEYLKGCIFLFPLPNQLYSQLLSDQQKKFSRQNFKRVVAHMILYMPQIAHKFIEKICNLCERQKIGITLLQIINLINIRNIKLQRNSLSKIASSIQHFKNMQSDLLKFVKGYCDRENIQIETKLFEPYIVNLTMTESYEQLNDFLQVLIQELKPKEYKINKKLSKEQNLVAQKEFKQKQSKRSNRQLFEMIKITANSLKVRTKIPPFMSQILEMYLSKKTDPMMSEEYGISLIVYSQDNDKFMDYLEKVKKDINENTEYVFECAVKCLTLFANKLKDKTDKILASTLYIKKFDLNQNFLKQLGYIFKQIDNPSTYTEYLQYVLRKQPPTTPEIKSLYYKIFNSSTDDNSKNQMNGLLDFIFNPNREKQRIQYKLIKQQEQKKISFLESLNTQNVETTQKQVKVQSNKNQIKQKKKSKKEKQVEQIEPKLQAVDQKIEPEVKQKKKSKNQQKKALKQQQKQVDKKVAKQKKEQKKQSKGIEIVTSQQLRQKKQQKQLAKVESCFAIDKNGQIVYTPKLWSRDLRTRSVKTFSQNFMEKFTVKTEQEPQKQKDEKSKSKKSKQGQKQGDKKQKKQKGKKSKQKQAVAQKKK